MEEINSQVQAQVQIPKQPVKPTVIILGIVAILALAAIIIIFARNKALTVGKNIVPSESISGYLPNGIILEKDVKMGESYVNLTQNKNVTQPATTYLSRLSAEENIVRFGKYLADNGWAIVRLANSTDRTPYFYATKGSSDVNITFSRTLGGIEVSIAYAEKK